MSPHLILKSLRSSPRKHRGDRITTMPMKTPPLPVDLDRLRLYHSIRSPPGGDSGAGQAKAPAARFGAAGAGQPSG